MENEFNDDNRGPGYFCPYVDPTWSIERVREALTLETELEGYRDYQRATRYRLLPGLW